MLGEPDRRSRGASQSRDALLFCTSFRFRALRPRDALSGKLVGGRCASTSTPTSASPSGATIGDDAADDGRSRPRTSRPAFTPAIHRPPPDDSAGQGARRRRRRASRISRSRRFRPPGDAPHAAEAEDLVLYQIAAVAGVAAPKASGSSTSSRTARSTTWRRGSPGWPRDRARGGHFDRADSVGSPGSELLTAERSRPAGRGRGVCRSRVRARRIAGVTAENQTPSSTICGSSCRAR